MSSGRGSLSRSMSNELRRAYRPADLFGVCSEPYRVTLTGSTPSVPSLHVLGRFVALELRGLINEILSLDVGVPLRNTAPIGVADDFSHHVRRNPSLDAIRYKGMPKVMNLIRGARVRGDPGG